MKSAILLSVITVTFNDGVALRSTLQSCHEQLGARQQCEFIVIDGGSTDSTGEVLNCYRDLVSDCVSEPDRGIYDAMNKGLALASGRYVMYLNAGDVWENPKALSAVCRELAAANPIWLVAGAVSLDGGSERRVIENIPHSWFRHAYGRQVHCHQSTFMRKDLLELMGGLSEQYSFAGDYDLILRVGLIAEPAYLADIVVTYAGGGVSAINGRQIPSLQHRIRTDRLQLDGVPKALDAAYMRYQMFRRWLHPSISAVKRLARLSRRSHRTM